MHTTKPLQVRCTEEAELFPEAQEEPAAGSAPSSSTGVGSSGQPAWRDPAQVQAALDKARKLPVPFAELDESAMSELAAMCKDGGLEHFVQIALKLG